jgi:RNA polymerase sigma factor (sigma-70 family)
MALMQSMDEIYRAHAQTVYRYLLTLTHSASLAEELTQETFYQAVKSIHRFDGGCQITTWLCAIAKNALATYRRKNPPTGELDEQLCAPDAPEEETVQRIGQVELLRAVHRLDGEVREVVYLRLFGDLSFRQIGEILDHTENWARVTYYRGKEKLKGALQADGK